MSKKIKIGDVVTAKEDITGFMFNIADKGTEGLVVGLDGKQNVHVAFRGNTGVFKVNVDELEKAKTYKIKAKKLGLGLKVKINVINPDRTVWVKIEELTYFGEDRVYVQGEDKTGQSYYEEFEPSDLVEVKQ